MQGVFITNELKDIIFCLLIGMVAESGGYQSLLYLL